VPNEPFSLLREKGRDEGVSQACILFFGLFYTGRVVSSSHICIPSCRSKLKQNSPTPSPTFPPSALRASRGTILAGPFWAIDRNC